MRRNCNARREGTVLAILFPPRVTATIDGTLVIAGGHLAVLGLSTGGVILFSSKISSTGVQLGCAKRLIQITYGNAVARASKGVRVVNSLIVSILRRLTERYGLRNLIVRCYDPRPNDKHWSDDASIIGATTPLRLTRPHGIPSGNTVKLTLSTLFSDISG